MGGSATAGEWDFFVSYTQADRGWAEWIAWQLEDGGYRVLVQAWDMVPGANWVHLMQEGVRGGCPDGRGAVGGVPGVGVRHGGVGGRVAGDPLGEQRKLLVVPGR